MGVLNVRYSVSLDACAAFFVEDEDLLTAVAATQSVPGTEEG
jgi:hypothetical protein